MTDLTKRHSPFLARLAVTALSLVLVAFIANPAMAKQGKSSESGNAKYASLVLDAETGKVISSRYADKVLHPASLTKMMTLYMVFRELEAGRMTLDSGVPISKHAAAQSPSKAGVKPGSKVKVRDVIGLLVTLSANDLAVAAGEKISGSEEQFGRDMTKVAQAMGMSKTRFVNASGLPDPRQVTSARDMAILARALLYHYPQYYHFFGLKNYSFNGKSYHTHNRLMNTFAGMDGLKTGFINSSGFNLVASAKRDGHRLIGVVFGGRSWQSRNDHMAELLNAGFDKVSGERPMIQNVSYTPTKPPVSVQEKVITASVTAPQPTPSAINAIAPAAGTPAWSIQVGAYSSQQQTQGVVDRTAQQLRARYALAQPQIVPFSSEKGTIYRARITGLSQQQAVEACRALTSCLVVQPNG